MSKSNLKNINSLSLSKAPYVLYNKSTYSNLLFKLNKSVIWKSSKNVIINKSLRNNNIDVYMKLFFRVSKKKRIRVSRLRRKALNYNPNTSDIFGRNSEIFFLKKL